MSEIQRLPQVMNPNPVHPNAKTTTQITNGTTTTKTNIGSPVCRNCKTQTTPLWRRDETGQVLCNACGLFLKLHGRPRPISLKTDTIKSRNRIKQPNFSKSSGPNTPELKSKDSKIGLQPHAHSTGRLSPPSTSKKRSPLGSPHDQQPGSGYVASAGIHSPLQPPHRTPFSGNMFPSQMGHFPSGLPHQVQSLHYPSSTPTQFAPGLQRITSPLLLSTTPSVSNARGNAAAASATSSGNITPASIAANTTSNATPNAASNHAPSVTSPPSSLTAMQAAGALENMSNELGPSASFKGLPSASATGGVSLLAGSKPKQESPALTTPSSALNSSPKPPSLPALGSGHDSSEKVLPSPSFGPQFALSDLHARPQSAAEHKLPTLPPIQHMPGSSMPPKLPHLHGNLGSASYSGTSTPEKHLPVIQSSHQAQNASLETRQHPASDVAATSGPQHHSQYGSAPAFGGSGQAPSQQTSNTTNDDGNIASRQDSQGSRNSRDDQGHDSHRSNNNPGGGHGPGGSSSYEVNALKTRISELELVNDLYRTRIMELEAMEQAARLRENSMRKRLDDLLRASGYEDSSSMLNSTMRVLKREDISEEDPSKRQKTQ